MCSRAGFALVHHTPRSDVAMDVIPDVISHCVARSIQEEPSHYTLKGQPWVLINESNGHCSVRCYLQQGAVTVRVHVTVFGDEAFNRGLVPTKLASKKSRLDDACRAVFRVLLRKYDTPHFAIIPLEPIIDDGNGKVHRIVMKVHKSGLLQEKLQTCASIAASMFGRSYSQSDFHLSMDDWPLK